MVDVQAQLEECKDRKRNLDSEKLSAEQIYKILVCFDKLYGTMKVT